MTSIMNSSGRGVLPRGDLTAPRGDGYGARVDDLWLRLAASPEAPLRIYSKDSLAERVDQRTNLYENVMDKGHVFARADLTGGAGLDWFPRRSAAETSDISRDSVRFWTSRNIDVSRTELDKEYSIRLHRKLETWGDPGVEIATALGRTSAYFFLGTDQAIHWYSSTADDVPEGNTLVGSPVDELHNLGEDMYALLESGVIMRKQFLDAGFTAWATPAANTTYRDMWTVKGRVVVQKIATTGGGTNELIEMTSDGTEGNIIDTYGDNVFVRGVVDAGPVVLAAVSDGYVYSYTLDESDNLAVVAQTEMPLGESPFSIAYNQGVVFYLTADSALDGDAVILRGYIAEVLDSRMNFVVGNAQLTFEVISQVGVFSTDRFSDMVVTRDEIWWSMYEFDLHGAPALSLFRLDIVTKGVNRANSMDWTNPETPPDPKDLITFETRKMFVMNGEVWAEAQEEYADHGWLITPLVNFGINTPINWIASTFDVGNLTTSGIQAELWRTGTPDAIFNQQDNSWQLIQRLSSSSNSGQEVPMVGVQSKQLALMVRLYPWGTSTVANESPEVRRFAIRAYPSHRDVVIEIPVNVSDHIEVPGRMPITSPRWGDDVHRALFGMIGKHVEALVLDPPIAMRGIVEQVLEPTTYVTERGSQGKLCVVTIRGSRITATGGGFATGDDGVGLGLVGVSTVGIGQSGIS